MLRARRIGTAHSLEWFKRTLTVIPKTYEKAKQQTNGGGRIGRPDSQHGRDRHNQKRKSLIAHKRQKGGLMPEVSTEVLEEFRVGVELILDSAPRLEDLGQSPFCSPEEWRFISRAVERLLYEPRLPYGGEKERKMVKKL